jgi:hypothetical protein
MKLTFDKIKLRFVIYGAFFFTSHNTNAQSDYFQQEVNYKINVRLNDVNHSIKAFEEIQYINNSPSALSFIYFHLWPNAYKNNSSALNKQLVNQGKTDLYFSKEEERGYIDSLLFMVNGEPVKFVYDSVHPDIGKLILNKKLKSLDSINISTPFFVKIPDAKFSRLGHTQQAYFITQWYPKPAVFDKDGWHAMPYLEQGEFYSEFGSFDVSITLPDNYVLAATGDRIDSETEENFLNNRVKQTIKFLETNTRIKDGMLFPPSSPNFKTIRFLQYRVHDFAWFADKRFYALHDQIQLPESKRTVDTWVFFTDRNFDLWKNAINYVNTSCLFYSRLLGDYPYNHVTAVDGTIMAGGGMEYPGITVIGNMDNGIELDVTIAHEVGHNWFYGILGSNERRYPYLDEGLNSFYEMRYIRENYPLEKLTHYLGRDSTFKLFRLNKKPLWKEKEISYYMSHLGNIDQVIDLSSEDYTAFNYGSIVYGKTPLAFDFLMDYMGESNFDLAMQNYYQKFKFKHPQPKDIIDVLAATSNTNLNWFQENFLSTTNKFDYKLKNVSGKASSGYILKIKNKTGSLVPFQISAFKNKKLVANVWYESFDKKRTINFPPLEVDYFKIDANEKLSEINRRNNSSKTKGLFKKYKPIELSLITALENPNKTQIHYLPLLGTNIYDGALLGLAINNYGFYKKKFDYLIAPFYGLSSNQLLGFTQLDYNYFPKKTFTQVTIGNKIKSFNQNVYKPQSVGINQPDQLFQFFKAENYLIFILKKHPSNSIIEQTIKISNTNLFVQKDANQFETDSSSIKSFTLSKSTEYAYVNQLIYTLTKRQGIETYSFVGNVQQAAQMAKISLELNYNFKISPNKQFELRCFFGSFLYGTKNARAYYAYRGSGYNGYDDYLYEYNYLGRNDRVNIGFNQFTEKDGAMKVWTPLGRSSTWLASINLKSPQLGILPLKLYGDILSCDGQFLLNQKILYNAGINFSLSKGLIDVYIPCIYSSDIRKTLELNKITFAKQIRFTLNIHKLVPKNFIQSFFII